MSVKIILIQDVPNLGEEGDVHTVKSGYARNYLLPQRFALPYNNTTRSMMASRTSAIEQRKKEKVVAMQSIQERLNGTLFRAYVRAAETGKLFGSITSANVLQALEAENIQVDRKNIHLEQYSIRQVGTYSAKINLYADISVTIPVEVLPVSDEHARETVELLDAETVAAEAAAAEISEQTTEVENTAAEQETATAEEEAAEISEQTAEVESAAAEQETATVEEEAAEISEQTAEVESAAAEQETATVEEEAAEISEPVSEVENTVAEQETATVEEETAEISEQVSEVENTAAEQETATAEEEVAVISEQVSEVENAAAEQETTAQTEESRDAETPENDPSA